MFYLSAAGNNDNPRRNYSFIPLPSPQLIVPIPQETGSSPKSASSLPTFCPPIPDLVFNQHTNYFMGASLPDSDDGDINTAQSFDRAENSTLFTNTNAIRIDTDVPLNPRRRKRTSPVTPMSLNLSHYPHSRVPSSSNLQPAMFDAFGPLPMELSLSPSLQRTRSRSASQNLYPPSQFESSRNPSPHPSTSSAPAATDINNQGTGTETTEPPPKKKRRRQALSCTECKRRKIRCDRVQPCAPCKKRGEGDNCRWHILEPACVSSSSF